MWSVRWSYPFIALKHSWCLLEGCCVIGHCQIHTRWEYAGAHVSLVLMFMLMFAYFFFITVGWDCGRAPTRCSFMMSSHMIKSFDICESRALYSHMAAVFSFLSFSSIHKWSFTFSVKRKYLRTYLPYDHYYFRCDILQCQRCLIRIFANLRNKTRSSRYQFMLFRKKFPSNFFPFSFALVSQSNFLLLFLFMKRIF